jgi:hypothetical protein
VVALFYVAALPVVFSGGIAEGRAAADHLNYHEPVVHAFAEAWPRPDLSNYHSATTPLYHLILAGARVAFDPSRRGLMLVASLFTAALLALLVAGQPGPRRTAIALSLPLVGSMYVLFPGIWLLPDNAAWLGVLAMLLLALRARTLAGLAMAGSLILLGLVLTRQIHLWAAGVLWAAAWLGPVGEDRDESRSARALVPRLRDLVLPLLTNWKSRVVRLMAVLVCTLPAVAAIGYFVWLWDGLIVPRYQGVYHGYNLATPAFFLAIVGSLSPFYVAFAWPGLQRLRHSRAWLGMIVVAALALAAVPATTYSTDAGRKSGLWNIVKIVPDIAHHTSPVILVLAPLGMVLLAALVSTQSRRDGWLFAAAMVGFIAAQTLSPELWQRYHEPFILILLALMCSRAGLRFPAERPAVRLARMVGPIALALAMGALSLKTLLTDTPAASLRSGDFERSVQFEPLPGR